MVTRVTAPVRAYRLGKRQERVDETRRRIIEIARKMFVEDGFHGVGLEDLARRAGVGRKTIYYQFGSKLGLLESLVADLGERGGVGDFVAAALSEPDIARAVVFFVESNCAFWEREYPVIRAFATLAASDADARLLVDQVYAQRREDLGSLARRARRAADLRHGWTAARLADSWWLLTSFETYDLLRRMGKSASEASRLLCDLCLSLIDLAQPKRGRRRADNH